MKDGEYTTMLDAIKEAAKKEQTDRNVFKFMSDESKFELLYSKMRMLEKRSECILNTFESIRKSLG